jgi:hypothetical protein
LLNCTAESSLFYKNQNKNVQTIFVDDASSLHYSAATQRVSRKLVPQ